MRHHGSAPPLLLAAAVLMVCLAGCGDQEPDPSAATAPPSTTTPPAAAPSAATPSESPSSSPDYVDVEALPDGPLPRVDVVVGSSLIHDGRVIPLDLERGDLYPGAMGSYDGVPIVGVVVRGGVQFRTVSRDGSTQTLGQPHDFYNYAPILVPGSGHLLVYYNDRGTVLSTYTVLDATTGEELAVLQDTKGQRADLDSLDPMDRAVTDVWSGQVDPPARVFARSPGGTLEIALKPITTDKDHPDAVTLSVLRADDDEHVSSLSLPSGVAQVVFEDDDSFLASIAVSDPATTERKYVVVRCTVAGACAHLTDPATQVSIAGENAVRLGR